MLIPQLYLLFVSAVLIHFGTPEAAPETTPATSNAAWELATPVYERYNILTTKCSYRSGQLERPLLLWFNGNVSVHAPLNQTYQFDVLGCARTTVVSDSSRTNWNISMTLDCDHVQLQCGMIKANGDAELSNLVDFTRLERQTRVHMSFPNISCDTFGIDRPSILWSIDHECRLVPPDEGLIEPLTSIQLVPILDTWHNDTTVVRLTFNGSATLSANGTLRCMHKLATTGEYICSEAFKFNVSVTTPTNVSVTTPTNVSVTTPSNVNVTTPSSVNVTTPTNSSLFDPPTGGAAGSMTASLLALALSLILVVVTVLTAGH